MESSDELVAKDEQVEQVKQLLNGAISSDLPNLYALKNILDIDKIFDLYFRVKGGEEIGLIQLEDDMIKVKFSKGVTPDYIHGDGTEPITYFSYKKNIHLREFGIPNIAHYISFVLNTIEIHSELFEEIYKEKNNVHTKQSTSPIIDRVSNHYVEGFYDIFLLTESDFETEAEHISYLNESTDIIIKDEYSYIHDNIEKIQRKQSFNSDLKKRYNQEKCNIFHLETDVESFFPNLYTHFFERMKDEQPINLFASSNEKIKNYCRFLDTYNQKINNNQTKGILTGPFSSNVSSELMMLCIDNKIMRYIQEEQIQATYLRYLDDMVFHGNSELELNRLLRKLQGILHSYKLNLHHGKTRIEKKLYHTKISRIEEISNTFPFMNVDLELFTQNMIRLYDVIDIKRYFNCLIENDDNTQMKTMISLIRNYIENKQLVIEIKCLSMYLYTFLKIGFINNYLLVHIYKMLASLLDVLTQEEKEIFKDVIFEQTDLIDDLHKDTSVEIWHYYLLTRCGLEKKEILDLFDKVKIKDNPLIFMLFIEEGNNCRINKAVFNYLYAECFFLGKNWKKMVMQSKWGLLLCHLYVKDNYNFRSYRNIISGSIYDRILSNKNNFDDFDDFKFINIFE